jgi:hypothetical protein
MTNTNEIATSEEMIDADMTDLISKVKKVAFVEGADPTDAEVVGIIVSKYFKWDGLRIAEAAIEGLRDSNFRALAYKFDAEVNMEFPNE